MTTTLKQSWPAPSNPKPIVFVGAGGIIRDAHIPAYRQAGLPIAGVVDTDATRAQSLQTDFDLPAVFDTLEEAVGTYGTDAVYDIATPPHVITDILPACPMGRRC